MKSGNRPFIHLRHIFFSSRNPTQSEITLVLDAKGLFLIQHSESSAVPLIHCSIYTTANRKRHLE